MEELTNEEDKSVSWRFRRLGPLNTEESHTMNNRANEVYVEDGGERYNMENNCDGQEAEASEGCHDEELDSWRQAPMTRNDRSAS